MKLTDTTFDGFATIAIDGEIDHCNIGAFDDLLTAHLSVGRYCLLVDLGACTYIDSAALLALLNHGRAIRDEGTIALVAPSSHIKRLLDIVGLPETRGFQVYDDLDSARAALSCSLAQFPRGTVHTQGPKSHALYSTPWQEQSE